MKSGIKKRVVDFPKIKTKKGVLVHRVTEIILDRTKTWEGLFIYRFKYTVRYIIPEYARRTQGTLSLNKINKQIREALIEIKGKMKDWEKESVKSLTQKLRGEKKVPNIETKLRTRNFEGIWEKSTNDQKSKKIRVELSGGAQSLTNRGLAKREKYKSICEMHFLRGYEESVAHIFAHCTGTENIRKEGEVIIKDHPIFLQARKIG